MSIPYQYSRLDKDSHQIRLLTLLPAALSTPIFLTINTTPLAKDNIPNFEALSYAWGSQLDRAEVAITSVTEQQTLPVARNLEQALRHLRLEDQPRVLWIDAICINQQDLPERSSQVKRMADIYSLARRVIVWLGPESDDSELAMSLMGSIGVKIAANWLTQSMEATSKDPSDFHWADTKIALNLSYREGLAIMKLFQRSWFERLWIWQEIWLAGPSALIVCGSRSVPWPVFRNSVFCLLNKHWPADVDQYSSDTHYMLYNLCQVSQSPSFAHLIVNTRHSKCTDPRDRVFALLSLCDLADSASVQPDYSKDVSEVYEEMFLAQCRKVKNLVLLQGCELGCEIEGTPSWLPNWSIPTLPIDLVGMFASLYPDAVFKMVGDRTLQVCGVIVGTIQEIVQPKLDRDSKVLKKATMTEIHRLASIFRVTGRQLEELCYTLGGGFFADEFYPSSSQHFPRAANRQQALEFVTHLLANPDLDADEISANDRMYIDRVSNRLCGRSVYRTETGNFGLACNSIKHGDLVVVLMGCSSAMILRPCIGNTYGVVGQSFYHGYMYGEALLGPIPDTHRAVWQMDTNGSLCIAFLEVASGVAQVDDPRLGLLPEKWEICRHDEMHLINKFVHLETGEETWSDPRLTPQALEERGARFQLFDLV